MEIQSNAITALNGAHQSLLKSASNIASKEFMQGNNLASKELIEMKQSEQNFSSVAKVIQAENDIMGTLLDIKV